MSWRTSQVLSYKFPTTISLRTTLTAPQLVTDARDKDPSQFFETPGLSSKEVSDVLQESIRYPPICDALATPLLSTLLPFTRLPANIYFPTREPPLPTSLLPNSLLSSLTRNQLIDALIGRRWRSSEAVAESVVDDISRKLTKVEFETRTRGYPSVVRTIISPILHKVRFVLGFVTSSQLVTRLNSSDRSTYLHSDSRPHQNITSWIERRLQADMAYPFILEECKTMKQGSPTVIHRWRPLQLSLGPEAFAQPISQAQAQSQMVLP
ncbi:uncharacterized protein IAS62_002948 [Cryptococcus decagattii]|uniref:Uncharacterized protein n=1 Tax=Cryptococcus decagattii TaxID=1859122 RepID=A0ABZ2AT50_9TREE